MLAEFSITKVIERSGVIRFTGATSDDRVDLYNTRCTQSLFEDWLVNAKSLGYPWLTIAHYPKEVAHVGDIDRMWIDNHYFKISGLFHDTELAQAAGLSLLNDAEGRIRLSSGFVPTDRMVEPGQVMAFTKGYLQHSALTSYPANLGAYVTAQVETRSSSHFLDASTIVGEDMARQLERAYAEYMIQVTGQHIAIPQNLSYWERISQMDELVRSRLGVLAEGLHLPIICSGDTCVIQGNQGAVILGKDCLNTDSLDLDDPLVLNWGKALLGGSRRSYLATMPESELRHLLADEIEIRMELKEVTPGTASKVNDTEVVSLHWRTHQLYAQLMDGRHFENLTPQDILQAHKILSSEIIKRGLTHNQMDELDKAATRFIPPFITGERSSVTLVPEYINLGGSSVRTDSPNDVDIIIRKPRDQRDTSEEVAIRRQVDPNKELDVRYVYAPTGPHDDYVPLFDLALVPVGNKLNFVQPGMGVMRSRNPNRPDFIRDMASVLKHLEGQSVLEMGCGGGYGLSVLEEAGYDAMGMDTNDGDVEQCHQLGLHSLQGDVSSTGLEDKSFDTVFSMHVLEHTDDPWKVIEESARVARRKAFHIVPLGKRANPEHKWVWYTVQDLASAFPNTKVYALPDSETAMIVPLETIVRSNTKLKPNMVFRPTKTGGSYNQQEFQDVTNFYDEWAKGYIEEGIPLDVEIKFNGWRLVLEYDGNDTLIYFEDSKKRK